jgi:hypothetical protein
MNKIKFYEVSDACQKKFPLPKLKKGEKVTYELFNLQPDPTDPEKDPRKKRLQIPFQLGIPPQDRVSWGKGEDAEWVDIAFITGNGVGGVPIFGEVIFHSKDAGSITLVGGRKDHDRQYLYMEMCNWNESNEYRDTDQPVIFKRKDFKKERLAERASRNLRVDAVKQSQELSLSMLRKISIGLFGTASPDEDELRMQIEQFAEDNPKDFLAMVENTDLNIMEIADQAVKKGFVTIDMQARKIISNGNTVFTWPPQANAKPYEKFVEFVKSEEGVAFYNELKERLKPKK